MKTYDGNVVDIGTFDQDADPHSMKITIFETANSRMKFDSVCDFNPRGSLEEKREEALEGAVLCGLTRGQAGPFESFGGDASLPVLKGELFTSEVLNRALSQIKTAKSPLESNDITLRVLPLKALNSLSIKLIIGNFPWLGGVLQKA